MMEETMNTLNSTWSRFHLFVGSLAKDMDEPLGDLMASASAAFTSSYTSASSSATSFANAASTSFHSQVESASSFWRWALSVSDPRVVDWPLMSSPWPTALLTLTYLVIVAVGPKFMENRKPLDLRWLMVTYNLSMVVLCTYIWVEITVGALRRNYSWICQPVVHDPHPEELRIAGGLWWFFVSKAIEFLDTFIFILRKKSSQVKNLKHTHTHNRSVLVFCTVSPGSCNHA